MKNNILGTKTFVQLFSLNSYQFPTFKMDAKISRYTGKWEWAGDTMYFTYIIQVATP